MKTPSVASVGLVLLPGVALVGISMMGILQWIAPNAVTMHDAHSDIWLREPMAPLFSEKLLNRLPDKYSDLIKTIPLFKKKQETTPAAPPVPPRRNEGRVQKPQGKIRPKRQEPSVPARPQMHSKTKASKKGKKGKMSKKDKKKKGKKTKGELASKGSKMGKKKKKKSPMDKKGKKEKKSKSKGE